MLEQLFGSKTRVQLLRLLFRDPAKAYYVRELTRLLDVQINAIRREITILKKAGLLKEVDAPTGSETGSGAARRKYYTLDSDALLFHEMRDLLIRAQLMDEQELVKEIRAHGGKISLFLVTGRFTGDKESPVDMLLVGNIKEKTVEKMIKKYEKKFGFEARYTTMSVEEFLERREMMDKFVYSIFEGDHLLVVNELED